MLKLIGSKINEACQKEDEVQPLNSELVISTLLKISATNTNLFYSSLDLFVSYFAHFQDERNKEYAEITTLYQKCNNQSLLPLNRFQLAKPLLLIIHCLSDTIISELLHFLVEIFNQLFDDPSNLSQIPFHDLYQAKKHCIDDFLFSGKLLTSAFHYLYHEFETTNSPGSALAFSVIIQQMQKHSEASEFTDSLIKFCFKSDLKFQCIGSFLLLSYLKATSGYLDSLPPFVFDSLKNYIISDNPTLQHLSVKAMKCAVLENLFDSFNHFKSILHQYTYYNDFRPYTVIMSLFIKSIDADDISQKRESFIYLAKFLHGQISNEKATFKEKDVFLHIAGILMLLDADIYGEYYEDDINAAVNLLETGQFYLGPAIFFAGASTISNRSIRQLISSKIPTLIDFASTPENDKNARRGVAESISIIVSNKLFNSFLPQYANFRGCLIGPSENGVLLQISKRIDSPFLSCIRYMEQSEAVIICNIAIRVLLSTTSPVQFKICLKLLYRFLKFQKISSSDADPVIQKLLAGTLPIFSGIPVYLYSGYTSDGNEEETVSFYLAKFLTYYLKSFSFSNQSQAANDLSSHLIARLIEWLPLALDSALIAIIHPLVQAIKMKKIEAMDVLDTIIQKLLLIPSFIGLKEHVRLISSTAEAVSLLLETYPDKFDNTKVISFLNNIDFDEFDSDDEDEEEEEEEEHEEETAAEEGESESTQEENQVLASQSNRRNSHEIYDDDDDPDVIEQDENENFMMACELIQPFKVKIAFLCLTTKHMQSLNEDVQDDLMNGFEYMFSSPKLDVAPSLFKLCLKVLRTNQSLSFKKLLAMEMLDFIFKPKWILVKYGIDEGIEKEVLESLVSIFKEQKKLYTSLRKYCTIRRHNFMMFNTYFRKLD